MVGKGRKYIQCEDEIGNWWQMGKNRDREGEEMGEKKRISTKR